MQAPSQGLGWRRENKASQRRMTLRIFEVCWNDGSYSKAEPAFTTLDWRHNPQPDLREFAVFRELHARGDTRRFGITGAFSPKFAAKTGVSGSEFIQWVDRNPGYDFYYVSPRPHYPIFYFNGWTQSSHKYGERFLTSAKEIIELAGYDPDAWIGLREDFANSFYMNFWIAKECFWDRFLCVIDDILSVDRKRLLPETQSFLFEKRNWRAPNQLPITLITIVLERVVTSYAIADRSLKKLAYPATLERIKYCCRNPAEWELYRSFAPVAARFDAHGLADSEVGKTYFDMAGRAVAAVSLLYTQNFGHPHGDGPNMDPYT